MKLESHATSITFFEDRARVQRRATADCDAGMTTLKILGISALVDDASLVVTSNQGAVKAAQVHRFLEAHGQGNLDREELQASVDEARRERDRAAHRERQAQGALEAALEFEQGLLTRLARLPSSQGVDLDAWKASLGDLDEALADAVDELHVARTALDDADQKLQRANRRLTQANQRTPRMQGRVDVQVELSDDSSVELTLEYIVPCALWRPGHRARMLAGDEPRVEVVTLATAWQRTGEIWEEVDAYFSTARLSRPSTAPLLNDDVVKSQPREEDLRAIQATVREQVIDELSDDRRAVDEMPGIDDGGRPLLFQACRPVTIESDGEPMQVECQRFDFSAEVEQLLYPELMDSPHLVARGVWGAPQPLLAGPVELVRDREFAGRSSIDFVAVGDPLKVGFGPNGAVRAQRRVDQQTSTAKLTGRRTVEREVHLFLSNLSGEAVSFEVIERVPASELDEVRITVDDHRPDRDGFIKIPVFLEPRQTRTISVTYRVEMSAKVELSL